MILFLKIIITIRQQIQIHIPLKRLFYIIRLEVNSITINLPKYEDKNINYIVLFIYKFIEENSDTLCLLTKNIIEQLFKINLLENSNIKEVDDLNKIKQELAKTQENIKHRFVTNSSEKVGVFKSLYGNLSFSFQIY